MKFLSIIGALLALIGFSTEGEDISGDVEILEVEENEGLDFGSEGALEQENFTLEEMLIYALEDEYRAKEEYLYVIETFDVSQPFSRIIESEETHIQLLLPLFEKYGIEVVNPNAIDHLIPADTLEETFEIGVIAEINNIAMYDKFLEQDLPDDIREVFIRLRDSSYNHLTAFERGVESNLSTQGNNPQRRGRAK